MAQRTGLATIRYLSSKVCVLIAKWQPVIVLAFPAATALHAQLAVVSAACQTLVELADEALPAGD